ncbi:hypothetical protein LSH36_226g05006 [Paralvinella palmiformis]|uniref:G-protein coupled receptors family 1 profile domain-containing protein n=1 Tax=Paralvinella palmiformis TaxID=53620 RepID=A0AAD9N5P3_9ANNE|nr:hypothetical protein LSH36_226g05006 [Paralvinella palmiformis]
MKDESDLRIYDRSGWSASPARDTQTSRLADGHELIFVFLSFFHCCRRGATTIRVRLSVSKRLTTMANSWEGQLSVLGTSNDSSTVYLASGLSQQEGMADSEIQTSTFCNSCDSGALATNTSLSSTPHCNLYAFIINTVVIGTVCIVGLLGNVTSFVVFWLDKVKTSSSFLFQALSVIDSVLLILVFPLYCVTTFAEYTALLPSYYSVYPFVLVYIYPCAFVAQTATIWVTVLVGVNRYIAVCKPYQAPRLCTVVQARKQLAVVLCFAIFYNIPKFFEGKIEWKTAENNGTRDAHAMHTAMGLNKMYNIVYSNIFYTIFLLSLPLLILTVLNIRLINALNALKRKRAEMQSLRQQQDNNVTLVLVVVIIVFTVCQVPALVNQILWNTLPNSARDCGGFQFYFRPLSNTLVIFNSAVNFFIYLFFNTRFKQVLKSFFCKEKEYEKVRTTATTTTFLNNHTTTSASKDGTNQSLL